MTGDQAREVPLSTGAPRVVGDGYAADGRITLTHVAGESAQPHTWREEEVGRVGELLRELHDVTQSFDSRSDAVWQPTWLHDVGTPGDVVLGHGDPAPWNIVGPNASIEALIDWDFAGPARCWSPRSVDQARDQGPSRPVSPHWLRGRAT